MRPRRSVRWAATAALGMLFVLGCTEVPPDEGGPEDDLTSGASDAGSISAPRSETPEEEPEDAAEEGSQATAAPSPREEGCPGPSAAIEPDGPQAKATVLDPGGNGRARVSAIVYPRPDYDGNPWSSWGQGIVLPDGRYWSAIGDHIGPDGNSYFFSYDSANETLTRFGDVLSNVPHQPGAWGFGKVHGQLVPGACGELWAATYWGTRRGLTFDDGYEGDHLLRLDTATYEITPEVVPVPYRGIPSLAGSADQGLVYGEAVDPKTDEGRIFAFDVRTREVVLETQADGHTGFRNILVAADGTAHFAVGGGRLATYEPGASELGTPQVRLPGEWLRASTSPADDGTVYGVTREPDRFFAVDRDGAVRDLGEARGYTTSMALDPDGEGFLYVPGAHGSGWQQGTPLLWVDGASGQHRTVVELHDLGVEAFDLRLAGTYSIAVDAKHRRVYVTMNAGQAGEESFGEVVLVIVELP